MPFTGGDFRGGQLPYPDSFWEWYGSVMGNCSPIPQRRLSERELRSPIRPMRDYEDLLGGILSVLKAYPCSG